MQKNDIKGTEPQFVINVPRAYANFFGGHNGGQC